MRVAGACPLFLLRNSLELGVLGREGGGYPTSPRKKRGEIWGTHLGCELECPLEAPWVVDRKLETLE